MELKSDTLKNWNSEPAEKRKTVEWTSNVSLMFRTRTSPVSLFLIFSDQEEGLISRVLKEHMNPQVLDSRLGLPADRPASWNHHAAPSPAEVRPEDAHALTRQAAHGQEARLTPAPGLPGPAVDHAAGRLGAGQELAGIGPISCEDGRSDRVSEEEVRAFLNIRSWSNLTQNQPEPGPLNHRTQCGVFTDQD